MYPKHTQICPTCRCFLWPGHRTCISLCHHVKPYGTIWYHMASCVTIWHHMAPCVTIWYHMALYVTRGGLGRKMCQTHSVLLPKVARPTIWCRRDESKCHDLRTLCTTLRCPLPGPTPKSYPSSQRKTARNPTDKSVWVIKLE